MSWQELREQVSVLASALALGTVARSLPALSHPPPAELLELRGISSAAVALLAAAVFATALALRGAEANTGRAIFLRCVGVPSLVLVPALIGERNWDGVIRLVGDFHRSLGWIEPVRPLSLAAALVALVYAATRLARSVWQERFRGGFLVAGGALVLTIAAANAFSQLSRAEATTGIERAEKLLALLVVLALLAAALAEGRRSVCDPRPVVLSVASLLTAAVVGGYAHGYLAPSTLQIERVLGTSESGGTTLLVASLRDRPDLHGVFAIPNASASPELVYVQLANRFVDGFSSRVEPVAFGWAYLAAPPAWTDPVGPANVAREPRELRIRSRLWPHSEYRSSLPVGDGLGWWASTSEGISISINYDSSRPKVPCTPSSVVVDVAFRTAWGTRSRRLVEGLSAARILRIANGKLWLLSESPSSNLPGPRRFREAKPPTPQRQEIQTEPPFQGIIDCAGPVAQHLALVQYDLHSDTWSNWAISSVYSDAGQTRWLVPEEKLLAPCVRSGAREGTWCILDATTLEVQRTLPPLGTSTTYADHALPLTSGRVIRLGNTGYRPLTKRAVVYGEDGIEVGRIPIAAAEEGRTCGELSTGEIWIARSGRTGGRSSLLDPIPGWTLEAWQPKTGYRRLVATELSAIRSQGDDGSCFFLDAGGNLLRVTEVGLEIVSVPRASAPSAR